MSLSGGIVVALAYNDGVAIASDRSVFAYNTPRLQNSTRQYRLNDLCLISFSGDFANFQWMQNLLERRQIELKMDAGVDMSPKMVHAFLTSLLYERRTKMNPLMNTLVVCGMQPVELQAGKKKPFIGIVTMRGEGYEVDHVATELGTFLLRQLLETRREQPKELREEEALSILVQALQVSITRNTRTGNAFDVSTVDASGVKFHKQIELSTNWDVTEVCDGTYF